MSDPPSSVSRPLSLLPTAAKRRLSLSALCNPTPILKQSTMPEDPPAPGPSSPPRSDTAGDEERRATTKQLSLNAEDESVMIAVRALDDMRSGAASGTPSSSSPSSYCDNSPASTSTSLSTAPQTLSMSPEESAASAQFVSRVSGLPIVNTALRAYEQSKASSRVVKYGAEMMESSMRSISKPVINRLPVNQIDEFACRQLDRLGKYGTDSRERTPSLEPGRQAEDWETRTHNYVEGKTQSTARFSIGDHDERELQSRDNTLAEVNERVQPSQEIANRSRWHSILYEAGGISAAVSEESMRRLKYCLQWLQYATEHTDGQILVLRNFIASLNAHGEHGDARPISASHMQTLTNVRRDVVGTIRQVVDVVSKYAGSGLPEPARGRVRQFILHLPQRWANTAHRQAHGSAQGHSPGQSKGMNKRHRRNGPVAGSGPASAASTAPSSPLHSPKVTSRGILPLPVTAEGSSLRQTTARPTAGSAAQAAQRILTLATESLDMMRNVTGICKESLDRADVWVDRLRIIGVQRQNTEDASDDESPSQVVHRVASEVSDGTLSSSASGSGSATATFTSFPPSPRSWPADAPSPAGLAASTLDSLTLNSLSASASALATPRSSTQSLAALGGYDWEYTARKLQTIRDADEDRTTGDVMNKMDTDAEERSAASALSALRGSSRSVSMDVDDRD